MRTGYFILISIIVSTPPPDLSEIPRVRPSGTICCALQYSLESRLSEPGAVASGLTQVRSGLRQRLTLIVFHIGDGVIQIRLSPQIFPAATICPRTLVSRPAATLPHFSSGVCFKSSTYVFGFTWGLNHRMDVISPGIHCP